jgi:hypothetical protein
MGSRLKCSTTWCDEEFYTGMGGLTTPSLPELELSGKLNGWLVHSQLFGTLCPQHKCVARVGGVIFLVVLLTIVTLVGCILFNIPVKGSDAQPETSVEQVQIPT